MGNKKPTIVCRELPRLGKRLTGVAKNIDGVDDGSHASTSLVVEMDILEKWVITHSGSLYYYEKFDKGQSHDYLGTHGFCSLCGESKEDHDNVKS